MFQTVIHITCIHVSAIISANMFKYVTSLVGETSLYVRPQTVKKLPVAGVLTSMSQNQFRCEFSRNKHGIQTEYSS